MSISLASTTTAGTTHYMCLSADIPNLDTGVAKWSTAVVTDSPGLLMVWDGDSWNQRPMTDGGIADAPERMAVLQVHKAASDLEQIATQMCEFA